LLASLDDSIDGLYKRIQIHTQHGSV